MLVLVQDLCFLALSIILFSNACLASRIPDVVLFLSYMCIIYVAHSFLLICFQGKERLLPTQWISSLFKDGTKLPTFLERAHLGSK